jgi:succinoglycan biosynthesis protein ExoW
LTVASARSEPGHAARIGVVIPYFQQESGLLHRTLSSVAAQTHSPVQVIVVDDGSPHPAAEEIDAALRGALPDLTVIRQANGGIAAARNAALDALSEQVTAVALLDSDDYWEHTHLRNAASALSLGADFFFSNSRSEGEAGYHFQQPGRRQLLSNGEPVQGAPGLLRWPESVHALMGAACPFATATVVFRRALMPDIRFPANYRRAGEDQAAFWELLARCSVVMYSTEPTLVYGSGGIGTWKKSTFGSAAHLVRLADEIHLRRHVLSSYPVSDGDRQLMRRAIAARRHMALYSAVHLLRRRREDALREIRYLLRADPACIGSWCLNFPKFVYRWARGVPVTTEWSG